MTFDEIIDAINIEPYYLDREYGQVIYCGDCRDILPLIPDKSIDLVLTDPPYGVGLDYEGYLDSQENLKELVEKVIPQLLRIATASLITCGVVNQWLYPKPTWVLSWLNKAGAFRNPWGFTCWQPILAYGSDPYLANRLGSRSDVIDHCETAPNLDHPCPKPVDFWKKLIIRGSVNPDDIVIDPFLGSGTTVMAAKHLNRKSIGIEVTERYCELAAKRLSQSVMRLEV